MLTALFKLFGLAPATTEYPLRPRQLDLSGNLVMFSMPENFSRDFPADDMVTAVDLSSPDCFSENWALVLERYWDFKAKGRFGGNVGTLQMTMAVKKVTANEQLNIAKREDFVKTIYHYLKHAYASFNVNKSYEDQILYSNLEGDFVDFTFNEQHWIRYSLWKADGAGLTSVFAIPITKDVYVTVAFAFAPGIKIGMRPFIDEYAQPHIDMVMETFRVKYNLGNPIVQELEGASGRTLEDGT